MSGFEIVGVVLDALPLLIVALQQYVQAVDTMKCMAKYRLAFSKIHVKFAASVSIFQYDCEDLLFQRLMLSNKQYREIMDNPDKRWDQDVVDKLQYALGKSTCDAYKGLLDLLSRKMDKLRRRLQLNPDGSVPFIRDGIIDEKECKEFFRGRRRIRGLSLAARAEKYKKLVTDIEADINQIHNLTMRAVVAEDRRHPQQERKEIPRYWLDMRHHMMALFGNLSSSWPESCPEPHSHHVQLLVDVPARNGRDCEDPEFRLSLTLKGQDQGDTLPWKHRSATLLYQNLPTVRITTPTTGNNSIRFTAEDTARNLRSCPSQACISDFCTALSGCTDNCLGILRYKDLVYHVHHVEDAKPQKLRVLQDLIDRQQILWQRKRCDLALALAYAVLQLDDTPWLRSSWDLKDIHFSEYGIHHHLWITKTLRTASTPVPNVCDTRKQSIIKNDALFALGVALLELACGRALSSFQTQDDLDEQGNEHALTKYYIADRLTKKLCDEDGPNFASAVSKCIHPASETHDFDLANERFRARFFKDVIQPLQEDYDQLFKSIP